MVEEFIRRHTVDPEDVFRAARERGLTVSGSTLDARLASLRSAPLEKLDDLADTFILAAKRRSAARGAVLGVGGLPAALVGAPIEIQQTGAVAVRMASAIMTTYGFSTTTEEGQDELLIALGVGFGVDAVTTAGATYVLSRFVASEAGQQAGRSILPKVASREIVKALSKKLALREGTRKSLGRAVPGLGAIIGAGVNWRTAATLGSRVKKRYRGRHDGLLLARGG